MKPTTPDESHRSIGRPKGIKYQKRHIRLGSPEQLLGDNAIRTSKYKPWNFVFLNLLEQFKKPANIYFLVDSADETLTCLQVIPAISISDGTPTILPPLLFVIFASMLKDFIEDCKRTSADKQENNSASLIWGPNGSQQTKWRQILTGNLIKIKRGEFVPADVVLLYSSNEKSDCYLETKNLDGETNLKMKVVPEQVRALVKEERDCQSLVGFAFDYEEPNPLLYSFSGRLSSGEQTIPIEAKSILLRGCLVKNTAFVVGAVVFTGHCTKIMMNSLKTKPKRSDLESKLGWQILTIFMLLLGFCLVASILYIIWLQQEQEDVAYLKLGAINTTKEFFVRLGNWVLIFG